jgi:thymidylate synthase (FAD)
MVELLDVMGNDLMVVNVARVSYGKWSYNLNDKDIKLLKYLYEHKHISPWKHPQLQFRITCPIFVERQLFKHQIGMSANSISGRYVDFSESFWELKTLRKQSIDSKQGSSNELVSDTELLKQWNDTINMAQKTYNNMVEKGVAKELARTVLPLALNTTFIWTGSMLAFLHLFELRLKPDAQEETRIVVQNILDLVRLTGKFEHTLKAWGYL